MIIPSTWNCFAAPSRGERRRANRSARNGNSHQAPGALAPTPAAAARIGCGASFRRGLRRDRQDRLPLPHCGKAGHRRWAKNWTRAPICSSGTVTISWILGLLSAAIGRVRRKWRYILLPMRQPPRPWLLVCLLAAFCLAASWGSQQFGQVSHLIPGRLREAGFYIWILLFSLCSLLG